MSISSAFKSYLRVRPAGIRDALRLFTGYGASILMKLLVPGRFISVGYLIPGRSNLTISISGVLANIRPRTVDLGMFATSVEPKTASWFKIKPGEIVVDVGAHIGRYTLVAAKHASRVITVEPEPSNFSMLKANIRLNGFTNIVALPVALSRRRGKLRFYIPEGGDTATSTVEQNWSSRWGMVRSGETVEVEGDTLDNLVASLGLQMIDWLKVDVEGHEVAVLQGASKALRRTKKVILEVSRGNEMICESLMRGTGFTLLATEKNDETSNWLLVNETHQGVD